MRQSLRKTIESFNYVKTEPDEGLLQSTIPAEWDEFSNYQQTHSNFYDSQPKGNLIKLKLEDIEFAQN